MLQTSSPSSSSSQGRNHGSPPHSLVGPHLGLLSHHGPPPVGLHSFPVLLGSFRSVWPIHPHFLALISPSTVAKTECPGSFYCHSFSRAASPALTSDGFLSVKSCEKPVSDAASIGSASTYARLFKQSTQYVKYVTCNLFTATDMALRSPHMWRPRASTFNRAGLWFALLDSGLATRLLRGETCSPSGANVILHCQKLIWLWLYFH